MRLSVISPTLNEAGNIPRLVAELERALGNIDYEILIVDDNSPDRTWAVAQEISAINPKVKSIRRMRDPGLSAAVLEGFSSAQGDVVACIDADLQHDPAILAKMLDELQPGVDVVVGSRYVDGGSTGEWELFRRIQSRIAAKAARLLLGVRLKDPMSGYFLFWRKDFSRVKKHLNGEGFKILLEILANLHPPKIKEVPYTFRPRTQGQSKLSGRVILQYLDQLWRLCSSSRHHSVRLMKSAVVGGVGVVINLLAMALLLRLTKIHDWKASAIASLAANAQNYFLNDGWSYIVRSRDEVQKRESYFSYLLMSSGGIAVTTASYARLTWGLARTLAAFNVAGASAFPALLSCQFVAIVLGVGFNYALNRNFDRRRALIRQSVVAPARPPALR